MSTEDEKEPSNSSSEDDLPSFASSDGKPRLWPKDSNERLNIHTTPLADLLRKVNLADALKKAAEVSQPSIEVSMDKEKEDKAKPSSPSAKKKKPKKKQKGKKEEVDDLESVIIPAEELRKSTYVPTPKIDEKTMFGQKSVYSSWTTRLSSSTESQVSLEVFHIVPITLPVEVQRQLHCEIGVDILMEQPWAIISKSQVIHSLDKHGPDSPFIQYASSLQAYPEEEILIGRASLYNSDEFVLALTVHGRNVLLEEIKAVHKDWISEIMKERNFPIRAWNSLGSEAEIEEENIKNTRPIISYDCALRSADHEKRYKEGFDYSEFYTELTDKLYDPVKNIEGHFFHKSTQVGPRFKDSCIQTAPEIPVNSTTQFTTEMRVLENEEILQKMDLDPVHLKQSLTTLLYRVDPYLSYNEEFDLHQDDYEILAKAGEQLQMQPNEPYDYLATMFTFIGTENRGITSTSWHPNRPGIIAAAYAKECPSKYSDLSDNSDEGDLKDSDSDDEKFYNHISTSNKFDKAVKKSWEYHLDDLSQRYSGKRDNTFHNLASTSLQFVKYARNMRLFQTIQAKKKILKAPDLEDLYKEDKFEYPLFRATKKHKVEEETENYEMGPNVELKKDYLFTGTGKWKVKAAESYNPISDVIKEHKKDQKKHFKEFLFREIWAGDYWNFGPDLEAKAIEANENFREPGIIALGRPVIPKHKAFLPGFKIDEYQDIIQAAKNTENEELIEIKDRFTKLIYDTDIDELSTSSSEDYFERARDLDDLDKLELQHYVVIWNVVNDMRPVHRLVCPFEVTSISFCPYDGRYIAGGTTNGLVAVWYLTKFNIKKIEEVDIDNLEDKAGFKHLGRNMCWFKRLSSIVRIPVTALSNKKTSHVNRIVNITWLPHNIQMNGEKGGHYEFTESNNEPSMQFMSTASDGTIKFWSLKSVPNPPLKAPFSIYSLQRKNTFPIPFPLQTKPPNYEELYLRWDPLYSVKFAQAKGKVSAQNYHVTCVSHDELPNKKGESKNVLLKSDAIYGTVDGTIALVSWQELEEAPPGFVRKTDIDGHLAGHVVRMYNFIHDGPITCLSRHPSDKDLFLSSGGHVFALWTIEMEEPLKWKKNSELLTTYIGWTGFKDSTFRVGFSDGTFELWDLMDNGNEAKMRLCVTSESIYGISVPSLPVLRGIVGIADKRGILKFYNVPMDYHNRATFEKNSSFFDEIKREKERKIEISKLAKELKKSKDKGKGDKVNVGKEESVESVVQQEPQAAEEGQARVKDVLGCRKFKEELYKWYLRRRGRNANWLDAAEKTWYIQEEAHMIKTILKNRKISIKSLETALIPLVEKKKHDNALLVKMEEIVERADEIFRNAIQELQVPREHVYKSQVSLEIEKVGPDNIEEAMKKVYLYFGRDYKNGEEELENFVKSNKIEQSWRFADLIVKYNKVREFCNDRRRYLNKDQRWLRELVKEELEKQGLQFSYWVNHEESYMMKKYQRRLANLNKLKLKYGINYDPYWDLNYSEKYYKKQSPIEAMTSIEILDSAIVNKDETMSVEDEPNVKTEDQKSDMPENESKDDEVNEMRIDQPEDDYKYGKVKEMKSLQPEDVSKDDNVKEMKSDRPEDDSKGDDVKEMKSDQPEDVSIDDEVKGMESDEIKKDEESEMVTNEERERKDDKVVETKEGKEYEDISMSKHTDESVAEIKSSLVRFDDNISGEGAMSSIVGSEQSTQMSENIIDKVQGINYEKENVKVSDMRELLIALKGKKERGEEIVDLDNLSTHESIESLSSISSTESSPDMSIHSQDLEDDVTGFLEETEEHFKEYFEGPPPRYEPPQRRPYFRAPEEDEPTEEWIADDKQTSEDVQGKNPPS